ncbi:hypothetical protein FJL53_22370 [Salmonella enterica subsp. enterica]|uniref:hypothetical protein n=1 Tax=Citrobacter sp. XY323 TaxID=2976537 RepID=UPI002182423D|nr:hypothetical protein [Citrobacter sp. XY323]EBG8282932.1 hypothetical protein [Salmonella enterica subsp. enterica serovar Muenchen]ELK8463429.1 hypothetical protein [Salmonella enterica]MCS8554257.1 hypothetical protein [Citrobacter sp. XY323]
MNINVSLYQPKRYTRWECHLDKEIHQLIGDCLYFTGWTKEEAIKSAVTYLESKGIVVNNVEIVSEKALLLSSQEQALKSYREKGGDMPTDTYLWG